MHTPILLQLSYTPFQIISPIRLDSFTNNFLAPTRFRPWSVGGIVNKLFRHGHSMTIPHINTYTMATTN